MRPAPGLRVPSALNSAAASGSPRFTQFSTLNASTLSCTVVRATGTSLKNPRSRVLRRGPRSEFRRVLP